MNKSTATPDDPDDDPEIARMFLIRAMTASIANASAETVFAQLASVLLGQGNYEDAAKCLRRAHRARQAG